MTGKKVLIADDEIHIIHVVAIKLRNNGYEVIAANNGAEAYELACSEHPDIVVTDYQMPFVTGIELIEKLRKNEATMHIPTILLTARSFAITQEMQDSLGVQECLSKPFSPKELLKTIEDILYQRAVAVKN
ncbi:MAG: response regulator [Sedimentisphaerales bacterium]|jgi:CheY-like chemotaxis protein|nr:response regulator [Sedimentisphaerales bacterium]NLZ07423.1 response regulator [Phycisphaerae bacterium]HNY78821.1 response regulator [Sedimentisphaerales bacterium]HOC62979.1 response regulator [Sedimentisphaerales bacterium]HOH64804.1 response regulator [Sedimentisphaerales bacterium]